MYCLDIEYCRLMTKNEIKLYWKYMNDRYIDKKIEALQYIENNKDELIDAYFKYDKNIANSKKENIEKLRQRIDYIKSKTCCCGSNLRRINYNGSYFWGCLNYKDGKKHITISDNDERELKDIDYYINNQKYHCETHWISDIKKILQWPDYIQPKLIYQYLMENGFEDLRIKYGYGKKTIENIMTYEHVNRACKDEEIDIKNKLKSVYPKVSYQVGIVYKEIGENEKRCFLDLIASDKDQVNIIEIKTSYWYIDIKKLNMYKELVKYVMKIELQDERVLTASSLVYNKPDGLSESIKHNSIIYYDQISNYESYNDLDHLFLAHDIDKFIGN